MLKSYLSQLELRVQAIQKLIGPISQYSQANIKQIREAITDFTAKIPKDVRTKFQRIKKDIEKYQTVIDVIPTNDQLTLVHSQLEELHNIANHLNQIQKLLPALNTQNYLKYKEQYKNLHLFHSDAQLEEAGGKITAKQPITGSIQQLRSQHRQSMNEILQLNGQIVKNLSIKLQALKNKKMNKIIA